MTRIQDLLRFLGPRFLLSQEFSKEIELRWDLGFR